MKQQIRRTYVGYFREDAESIDALEEMMADIINATGCSRSELIRQLIRRGATGWYAELSEQGRVDPFKAALFKFIERKRKEQSIYSQLEEAYERAGHDEFVEWCSKTEGIDQDIVQEFLQHYTWQTEDLRWSQRVGIWLEQYLSDGQPHQTKDLRQHALADGLITDDDRDWSKMRVKANRMGLTKNAEYGTWQLRKIIASTDPD